MLKRLSNLTWKILFPLLPPFPPTPSPISFTDFTDTNSLPPQPPTSTSELCSSLIDAYFDKFNAYIPVIDRQRFNEHGQNQSCPSRLLVLATLTVAASRYSDDPSIQKMDNKPAGIFYDTTKVGLSFKTSWSTGDKTRWEISMSVDSENCSFPPSSNWVTIITYENSLWSFSSLLFL